MDNKEIVNNIPESKPLLRVLPLGGLLDIGGNATLLETKEGAILIDCGLLFPNDDEPGIDYLVPSLSYIKDNNIKLLALFITHGHEDHIGAIPYLLENFDIPVYGSALALGLLANRLKNVTWQRFPVNDFEEIEEGPFKVTFIPVTHSVPFAFALKIVTPAGVVIHSGDFKIDPRPRDGRLTAVDSLQKSGDEGVLLLLSDSTNAREKGQSPSEYMAASRLTAVIASTTGRVAVTTFASHLHRVAAIIEASVNSGRRVMLVGKAMREAVALGKDCGIIDYPEEIFLNQADYPKLEDKMVTIIASGSQGEAYSAMTQIAYGEHGHVDLEEGDVAIFSARHIPGNEQAISRAVNALVSRGVKVYTEIDGVHASGHGYQEELAKFIELLRPKYFVPIHGQPIQRVAHRELAMEKGLLKENTFILSDGQPLDFYQIDGEIVPYSGEPVEASYLSVDGKVIGDISEQVLADRRDLSEHGVLFCSLVVDENCNLITMPKVTARGLILLKENTDFFDKIANNIADFWPTLSQAERLDDETAFMEIKRVSRSLVKAQLGRRPLVVVTIHRLNETDNRAEKNENHAQQLTDQAEA